MANEKGNNSGLDQAVMKRVEQLVKEGYNQHKAMNMALQEREGKKKK